jgi:hypothetical protein
MNYHEASVAEDGEWSDFPVEDPVLSVTASFPESNPFGRKFPALLSLTVLFMKWHNHRCSKRGKQ